MTLQTENPDPIEIKEEYIALSMRATGKKRPEIEELIKSEGWTIENLQRGVAGIKKFFEQQKPSPASVFVENPIEALLISQFAHEHSDPLIREMGQLVRPRSRGHAT